MHCKPSLLACGRFRNPDAKVCLLIPRRYPPPWFIEDIGDCFVVRASNNRPLVFIYYGEGRIAVGIAKLPGLVQWPSKGTH